MTRGSSPRTLEVLVAGVVRNGNCSGCGACAAISPTIAMGLDEAGFLRPAPSGRGQVPADAVETFRAVCPGVRVDAPDGAAARDDPTFGPFVSSWTAWATDSETRWRGSSGGVLTALSTWLLSTGAVSTVAGVAGSADEPVRTVPVTIVSREDALAAAGSRYAPVGAVGALDMADPPGAFIGKPCEVDAARRLVRRSGSGSAPDDAPLLLSFFCAGVPSQNATVELIEALGVSVGDAESVKYRGQGCPGDFVVTTAGGASASTSYDIAWGGHLGRRIQDRCKICPDGTGMHADIAVGDFWRTDAEGYPVFADGDGVSVAIARTARGHEVLMQARAAGVLAIQPVELADVAAIQPLQVRRRLELAGRLVGRALAGDTVPRFRGFAMTPRALRRPRATVRAIRGAYGRARARRAEPAR